MGKITRDPFILNSIQGCSNNFIKPPVQKSLPHQIKFNHTELKALKDKIAELLYDKVIEECNFEA